MAAVTVAVRDPAAASEPEQRRLKSRILGDFDNVVVYVDRPVDGGKRWRLVSRSDIPGMPPGITANVPMEDATRIYSFFLNVQGDFLHANIFAKVEAGS